MDRTPLLQWLSEHGEFVFVMVGTDEQARRAIACGGGDAVPADR
jgi:hypothetical protein